MKCVNVVSVSLKDPQEKKKCPYVYDFVGVKSRVKTFVYCWVGYISVQSILVFTEGLRLFQT